MFKNRISLVTATALVLLAPITGCVSRTQGMDFIRTEFARVTADLIGQIFLIFVQATSPFGAA